MALLDMPNHLVLLAFGKQEFYQQALFLIISAITLKKAPTHIHVYSDNNKWIPDTLLPELNCVLLSNQQISELKGNSNFVYRVKILIIKDTCLKVSGNVLFIDSDCFIKQNLSKLFSQINKTQFVMHKPEFALNDNDYQAIKQLVEFSKKEGILTDVDENYKMWNSGAIGGKASILSDVCDSVLTMTDSLLKFSKHHTLEQLAFSVCLQRLGTIVPAYPYIYHYWDESEKKYMVEYVKARPYIHLNNLASQFRIIFRTVQLYTLMYRIRHSYIFSLNQALLNFESNNFSKGYWYTFKATLTNCRLDYDFLRKFRFHSVRHIKHIAKQILNNKIFTF